MKLMKAEAVVEYCKKKGVKLWAEDDDISMQGGNISNLPNSHNFWKIIKLHRDILCEYFGVSK